MKQRSLFSAVVSVAVGTAIAAGAASFHLDSDAGDDSHDGRSPQTAWKTLARAGRATYHAGDSILLKRGSEFRGRLQLSEVTGEKERPVVVDTYGANASPPRIEAAGYIAGIAIEESEFVEIRNLEITSDGGKAIDEAARTDRYGVHVNKSRHISVSNLLVHSIFATVQTPSEGKDKTTAYGHGVRLEASEEVKVEKCRIERVGRYGINARKSRNIHLLDNRTDQTGCSGAQMSRCKDVVVRGNRFNHSGSFVDKRMHGRGSGSWVWSCTNVLYEKNELLNARGKGDSCGVHIDFNCNNVVVQRCFSMNNEGGFIEILGNNHHCVYRYNVSVNDGFRRKGKDGADQEGKVLWLSGFRGRKKPHGGPFNSYIYNNTIYVKEGGRACFSLSPTARGALVANNIFHLQGPTLDVLGDQDKKKQRPLDPGTHGVVFSNNLYLHDSILPPSLGVKDSHPIIGNADFRNPGGKRPKDYTPRNTEVVKNRGMRITRLPGDDTGPGGLEVSTDFFGNPIKGMPDIGAIELPE